MGTIALLLIRNSILVWLVGAGALGAESERITGPQAGGDEQAVGDSAPQFPACVPGWTGRLIINCESTSGWGIEHDDGATGTLTTTAGVVDEAVQLHWAMGTGNWVQARYTFRRLIDLSREDILGVSLRGDSGSSNVAVGPQRLCVRPGTRPDGLDAGRRLAQRRAPK